MTVNGDNRTRAKAWAAGIDAARRRAGLVVPDGVAVRGEQLRRLVSQWVLAELAPGRLMPWLPIAFGFGIVAYFTADREPAWWAAITAALAALTTAILARRRSVGFPLALGSAAIALGFVTAALQTKRVAHPILPFTVASAQLEGFVEVGEERERIDWMIWVALWVTSLPGAVGHMRAFGAGPLLLATAGLLLLCLLRTPLRWCGAALVVAASLWAVNAARPDVLIAADGRAAAIRRVDGRLAVLASGRDTFAIKEWLAADGDGRLPADKTLHEGIRCDAVGCLGYFADGRLVSMVLNVEAFAEDCARAAVVVSAREAPGDCAAYLIDRRTWRARGATALRWTGNSFEATYAQPPGYDRPWARAYPASETVVPLAQTAPRDATPRTEDLEPGD